MYAIIDVETTGGGITGNKITEIAIIRHDGERILDEFQTLVNPEQEITYFVSRLTGITNEMVSEAPKFYEVAKKVLEMTRDCVFVAHNVNFDYHIVKNEFRSLGGDFRRKRLCTVRLSRKAFPGYPSYSLGNICSSLEIPLQDRHRAYGDTLATVKLFEKILQQDKALIDDQIHVRSRETSLPPHLPREVAEKLPEKTGVYYFKNQKGKVIYTGKAKNIKQRVFSHFYTQTSKEMNMLSHVYDISYEITGSEVVALLFESAEIKRLYPHFNRSQRRDNANVKVFSYTDHSGVFRLTYGQVKAVDNPLRVFTYPVHARNFLEALKDKHGLCSKYCGLQKVNGPCFDFHLKKCAGVCAGKETVESYNSRVGKTLKELNHEGSRILILDKGKKTGEKAVVLVENGIYLGYGYIPVKKEKVFTKFDEYKSWIIPQKHNNDTIRIINQVLKQEEGGWEVKSFDNDFDFT